MPGNSISLVNGGLHYIMSNGKMTNELWSRYDAERNIIPAFAWKDWGGPAVRIPHLWTRVLIWNSWMWIRNVTAKLQYSVKVWSSDKIIIYQWYMLHYWLCPGRHQVCVGLWFSAVVTHFLVGLLCMLIQQFRMDTIFLSGWHTPCCMMPHSKCILCSSRRLVPTAKSQSRRQYRL